MAFSVLDDKSKRPDGGMLAEVLGDCKGLWDTILAHLAQEYPGVENEWSFAGEIGWSLRPKYKKRTILYLTPGQSFFTAGFALGERAVLAAEESTLPSPILDVIRGATKYAEGRGVRIKVKRPTDIEAVKTLIEIKMAH